jgi:hypothetical protein
MTAALDDCPSVTDALVTLGMRWTEILLEPELAAIRRAIIAGASRFPELFAAWGDRGPEPSVRVLAGKLAVLAQRGQLLRLGEPVRAARQLLILLKPRSTTYGTSPSRFAGVLPVPESQVRT